MPQRGSSACTYIAGMATLRFAFRAELPTAEIWADCVTRGVQAYCNAREANPDADRHVDIYEALPYVLPLLGLTSRKVSHRGPNRGPGCGRAETRKGVDGE